MKNSKRFLSMLLAVCLVLSLIPGNALAASSNFPFTDVNPANWYYNAVQYVYEKGMMSGTSSTTFSPAATTTRGMIVTVLHRMEGTPVASSAAFTDVATGKWYTDAIAWANENDIVGGYGNGLFGPDDTITREQMATILYRYSQYKGYNMDAVGSLSGFSDTAQTSSYAIDSMVWAVGCGLISGVGNSTLSPRGNATRAQVATILMRYCEDVVPTGDTTKPTPEQDTTTNNNSDTETYTVTFDLNYGSDTQYDRKTVKAGETVGKPSNPSRSGYSFSGWYAEKSGGSQFDFKKGITSDLTLYAHWSKFSSGTNSGGHSSSGGGFNSGEKVSLSNFSADEIYFMVDSESTVTFTVTVDSAIDSVKLFNDNNLVGTMYDNGLNGDIVANDGIYTCISPVSSRTACSVDYYAKVGDSVSENTTIYFFAELTEEAVAADQERAKLILQMINSIEAEYRNNSGYVSYKSVPAILTDIEMFLESLLVNKSILRYIVDDTSIYIKLLSGIALIYTPALENVKSGSTDDGTASEFVIYQPNPDIKSNDLVNEYITWANQFGKDSHAYDGKEVDLKLIQSMKSNQVIYWSAHGGYIAGTKTPIVCTGINSSDIKDLYGEYGNENPYSKAVVKEWIVFRSTHNQSALATITPQFIDNYCEDLSNSLIILTSCYGGYSDELADSFTNKGAVAVLAFTDEVYTDYADVVPRKVLEYMSSINPETNNYYTLSQALHKAKKEYGDNDFEYFKTHHKIRYMLNGQDKERSAELKIWGGVDAENYRLSSVNPSGDFTITGGVEGKDYKYSSGILTILTDTPLTIKNKNPRIATTNNILIGDGVDANITLSGVDITDGTPALGIVDDSTGNVTITLAKDTVNKLVSVDDFAGLQKKGDSTTGTLTITGDGSLIVTGGTNDAGIGGGSDGTSGSEYASNIIISGNINISSASPTATILADITSMKLKGGTVSNTGTGFALKYVGDGKSVFTGAEGTQFRAITRNVAAPIPDTYYVPEGEEEGYYYLVKDTCTVSYNANGGGSVMLSNILAPGEIFTLPQCQFTAPKGKQFKAWQINGVEYAVGDTIRVTGDITVYAQWKENSVIPESAVMFNGHYYQRYDITMNWQSAEAFCEGMGGHLVTIISAEEQQFLESYMQDASGQKYMIGLHRSLDDLQRWVTGEEVIYTNWGINEPDNNGRPNSNSQPVVIFLRIPISGTNSGGIHYEATPGQWDDDDDRSYGFICEWDSISGGPIELVTWDDAYKTFILDNGYLKSGQTYFTANRSLISFGLHDMDSNGIPELIVSNGGPSEAQRTHYVYTYMNGSVVYVGATSYRASSPIYVLNTQYPGIFDESLSTGLFRGTYYYMKDGKYFEESVYYGIYDDNGRSEYQDTSDNKLYELFSNAFVDSGLKQGLVTLQSATVDEITTKGWESFISSWKN